jgi:hypothetical protein
MVTCRDTLFVREACLHDPLSPPVVLQQRRRKRAAPVLLLGALSSAAIGAAVGGLAIAAWFPFASVYAPPQQTRVSVPGPSRQAASAKSPVTSAGNELLVYGAAGSGMIVSISVPTPSGMILRAGAYPNSVLGAGWIGRELCSSGTESREAAIWREALEALNGGGLIQRDYSGGGDVEVWRLTPAGHSHGNSLPNSQEVQTQVNAAKAQTAEKWQGTIDRFLSEDRTKPRQAPNR